MLWQGILLGLSLSFMVGPLLFAIVEAGVERGFRAGLAVAAGIWVSDVVYVVIIYRAIEAIGALVSGPQFRLWAGLAGGALLLAFGLSNLLTRPPESAPVSAPKTMWQGYAGLWLRGFLINTVNPFTIFFWLGIAATLPAQTAGSTTAAFYFLGGMLGTLVLTDILKAGAAKWVSRFLTPGHIRRVRQGIGLLLVGFGVVLIIKVLG